MVRFGSSPFAWMWDGEGDRAFCTSDVIRKNYRLFYTTTKKQRPSNVSWFEYDGDIFCLQPKSADVKELIRSGDLTPVLGNDIACPVEAYPEMCAAIPRSTSASTSSASPSSCRHHRLEENRRIVEETIGKRIEKQVYFRCIFHDDRNPSATYNPESGYYKCHACGVKGYSLGKMMEKEKRKKGEENEPK
jgi:hypothetical protein